MLSRPQRWGSRDEPLWAEVFSPERLEQHAESLAEAQTTGDLRLPWFSFARRSADNERVLVGAYDRHFLAAADYMARKIPGAARVTIPEAGHASNLHQPALFNRTVADFLASLPNAA